MKRSLTGIQPSGSVHIGNYLGMIEPALALQEEYECIYMMVDLHALTTVKDGNELRKSTLDTTAMWLAAGFNYQKNILFVQSYLPHAELTWYLCCVTGMGLLEKGHAYKDAREKNKELNAGVFYYPALMAADILLYDTDVVPVGKDQKQHVEMARDMAGSFNAVYGEDILKLPEVRIKEEVMTIPGLDGQKMSKSYNNTIELMLPEKQLRKKVMSLTTDSTPLEEPKSMKDNVLGDLYKLFATSEQFDDLENRLQAGGLGWGHAKEELFVAMNEKITPMRKKYEEIRPDDTMLKKVLQNGAERAGEIAYPILNKVREAVGVR